MEAHTQEERPASRRRRAVRRVQAWLGPLVSLSVLPVTINIALAVSFTSVFVATTNIFEREGPAGERGETGVPGEPGLPGVPGNTGPPGTTGRAGPTGDQGQPGVPGVAGRPGNAGPQGADGPPGPPGEPGPIGENGVAGGQGVQGIQGLQGVPGISGYILGSGEKTFFSGEEELVLLCPDKKTVIGGGGSVSGTNVRLTASEPAAGAGWRVEGSADFDESAKLLKASVICGFVEF